MNEVENINIFKLILSQEQNIIHQSMFDGKCFSQQTRKYVDIRKILPMSINQLQKVLSRNTYNTTSDQINDLDYFDNYLTDIETFPKQIRSELEYNPNPKVIVIENMEKEKITIRGVECKLALYRNNTLIVERLFYVDRFNPIARWSNDLDFVCKSILRLIFEHMKKNDINFIWNEYEKSTALDMELVME